MFKLTPEAIVRKSSSLVFKNGNEYYLQNKIKSIQFNQEKLNFEATVLGTRHYYVRAHFEVDGELHSANCTCPAFLKQSGLCKHIVAVLLLIKDKDDHGFFSELKFRQAAKHIFGFFQNRPSAVKTLVEMEITYEFHRETGYGRSSYSALEMRIGEDKLYIVRNIKKFFESIEKNEEIEFGKKFIFDPSRHCFKEEDKAIIQFLKELYEAEKLMEELSYSYNRASLFREKQVCLTNSGVKRFFASIGERPFKARIHDKTYEDMIIRKEDFPIHFLLTKEGNDLLLNIDFSGPLIPLTEDGEYFYAGDSIYRTSPQQQEHFKPFYMAMAYQQGKKLRFIEEDKERFVSEILPFAEKAGSLVITENVQSMIEKVDLEAEVYLDRSGDAIVAEVRFNYGERVINPFAPQEKPTGMSERILIRDIDKERMILDILAEPNFKVKNHQIHLSGDDDIFDFVTNIIPRLQEQTSVFYSETFKNITLKSSISLSGRIRLNTENDMLEFNFDLEGIDRSELDSIFKSLREKKRYYQLKSGSFLNLNSREIRELSDFMEHLDLQKEDFEKQLIEIPKYRALYLDQYLREAGLSGVERGHAFKELVQNIREPADMEFEIPHGLKNILRGYQRFGFKWLKTLAGYKMGGILADDMGLGKTLQVIALILSDKHEKGAHPSLVVAPTSLVYNWSEEIAKFAPELDTVVISGNRDERQRQREEICRADIVITSYPLIRRDIDDYREVQFRYCILDEAQHIKNPASQNAKSVKEIKAEKRFALTGTPVENALSELWSIFDFILPGYLFSHTRFVREYEGPIVKEGDHKAAENLRKQIRPFILRRVKSEVLQELPEKVEHKLVTELTEEQKKIYLAYLQQIKKEIDEEIRENGFEKSHIRILAGLTRLRQICCHPSVFIDDFNGESGKLLLLLEIIQESIESGHRILLFSQFTSMLAIIRKRLENEEISYMYLDGSTKAEERMELVKAFNGGQGKVFLISLKAGGTGLNLTGADTVIHYDPWWNPAVEDQATDRAYRIGQLKSVHVMKLITRGTIEEKIFELQEKKKKLIDAVIQPGETLISKLSEAEVRALFE